MPTVSSKSSSYRVSQPPRDLLHRSTPATQQQRAASIVRKFSEVSDTILLANDGSADLNGADLSKVKLKDYTQSNGLRGALKSGAGLLLNAVTLGALGKRATPPNPLQAKADLSPDGRTITQFEAQTKNPDSWATANLLAEPNSYQGPEMKFAIKPDGSKSYAMRSPDSIGINRTEYVIETNGVLRYTESYASYGLLNR